MKHINLIYKSFLLVLFLSFTACESLVEDINENPNDLLINEIDSDLFLTGAMLANTVAQAGHLNRISGMYTGQLIGFTSLYGNIYGFDISTAESVSTWSRIYVGAIPNLRHIRRSSPDDNLLVGISKVVEAHAIGTAASIFGDVPYTEIENPDISDPQFDSQVSVFNDCISLLDEAIGDLGNGASRSLSKDIHFEGDKDKWIGVANTLKARYYLQLKDYGAAYTAALSGISSHAGSMQHIPRGDASIAEGDKNLFWTILEGSRAGDIGTGNSFLMQLINPDMASSRNNAKTDETARFGYYSIDETGGSPNTGIIEQFEPQNLVSYAENLLILAEAGGRTQGMAVGLGHLNDLRAWMNTGGGVNANFQSETFLYENYDMADFAAGGIENSNNVDPMRAFLREVIEERYVSGFGMYMPYNDARRLRANESDIAVPYVLVDGPAPPYPERMPYSDDELNSNANAPAEDPGIFNKTEVNQ